ncbi:MAG: nuclear transport factor 2 family protein [Burkholderiaceae bacterium]
MPGAPVGDARTEVMATERAFARTMAERDHAGFARFIADEAIFFTGPTPLRGKRAVVDGWARLYADPKAPFSWEPDTVEVLAGGSLALSSGPVHNPDGKLIARFTSIWRRTSSSTWEIVFDKGNAECDCKPQ